MQGSLKDTEDEQEGKYKYKSDNVWNGCYQKQQK